MRRIVALLLIFASLMAVCGCAVKHYDNPLLQGEVRAYVLTNAEKLRREQEPEYTDKKVLTCSLAKNESEGLQFAVNPKRNISNLSISISALVNGSGQTLKTTLYREHYIETVRNYADAPEPGFYPDALIPMEYDDLNTCAVLANENQAYWINVSAQESQVAGKYFATVTLSYDGGSLEIPVEVEVWDFAIPTTPSYQSAFGLWPAGIWTEYKKYGAYETADLKAEQAKYAQMLLDHRCNTNGLGINVWDSPENIVAQIKEAVKDERVNSIQINYPYDGYENGKIIHNDNNAFNIKLNNLLEENNLIDYVYYAVIDEPSLSSENAKFVRALCEDIKSVSRVRNVITTGPNSALFGYMGTWCPLWNRTYMNEPDLEKLVTARRAQGEDFWWYSCVVPKYPAPSYHIDDRLMSSRLVQWMQKDYNIYGNLYWTTTVGEVYGARNIWTDAYIEPANKAAGDGLLIYTGVENDGVINRNIPVPTIRLESIRDGAEDFEYLVLLENKYKALIEKYNITDFTLDEIMDTFYTPLYNAVDNFDTDPQRLLKMREIVAKSIMAEDDCLVAVLQNTENSNYQNRRVYVYAPQGSEVEIDGIKVSGSGCVFSAEVTPAENVKTVKIVVNGNEYERLIGKFTSYEYDAYNEKANAKNTFEVLIDAQVTSSDGENIQALITVQPPQGAQVKINGVSGNERLQTLSNTSTLFAQVEVTAGDKTEIFRKLFLLNTEKIDIFADLANEATIQAINEVASNKYDSGFYKIYDGQAEITFNQTLSRFTIPAQALEITDLSGYSYIRVRVKNNQQVLAKVPVLALLGNTSLVNAAPTDSTMLIPGESRIVYYAIPLNVDKTPVVKDLTKIYIASPEAKTVTLSYTISNIEIS